jgi:hypothetical protein
MSPSYELQFNEKSMAVINMDDPNVWIQACEQQATLF